MVIEKKRSIKLRKYTKREFIRELMNKVEFIGKIRKICFDYFENMRNRIITRDKITHVVPYMVVVK